MSGGAPRKLRDEAIAYNISPDGSLISFGSNRGRFGDREIWLMGPDGTQARVLYGTGEDSSLLMYYWSPDGQRVVYSKTDESGTTVMNRDMEGGPPTILFPPSEMAKIITDFTWLPDGRLIYPVREPGAIGDTCNYWAMRLETRTGQTIEKPRQLLIIWLLQQAPIGSVWGGPTAVPKTLRQFQTDFATESLPAVSVGMPLAGWLCVSAVRARKSV